MAEKKAAIWATHHKSKNNKTEDLIVVKERISDGDKEWSNVRLVKNYKRPYYITKEGCRDHKQKRDWEHLRNLDKFECTDSELAVHALKNLGGFGSNGYAKLREVNQSPYLYGTDVTAPVLVREEYRTNWPGYNPKAKMGVLDFETDATDDRIDSTNPDLARIITGAFTYGSKVYLAATREWLGTISDPEKQIRKLLDEYIEQFKVDIFTQMKQNLPKKEQKAALAAAQGFIERAVDKLDFKFKICDDEYEVAKALMSAVHKESPDFLVFWNMLYDVKVMMNACYRARKDPSTIFCDPRIPEEFRNFYLKEDQQIKTKSNGDTFSKDFIDLWHTVKAASGVYFVDAMAFYRLNRVMMGKLNSYALEAILKRELGIGKLKFVEGGDLTMDEWHYFMQTQEKVKYMLYNIFDCWLVELLDEKTKDIKLSLPVYVGVSEIDSANSNPKRLADDCYFFQAKKDKIIRSTSNEMADEFDRRVLGTTGWIITLPSELVTDTGRSFVEGIPDRLSRFSAHCGDIDLASSYPTTGTICNVSPDTTRMEIYRIDGLTEAEQRRQGIDFVACQTNAVQLSRAFYKLPTLDEALALF